MGELFEKKWLDEHLNTLPIWQQEAFQSFNMLIGAVQNKYPCIPARRGFLTNNLRFSFVGDPRDLESAQALAKALGDYGKCSRETGQYASLVVFFETPNQLMETYNVESYRNLFWSLLNNVSSFDPNEWPFEIPTEPTQHKWEFCFGGEPYFSFCATPAHHIRKSRFFPCFLIAFQPRWVFDELNRQSSFRQKMKSLIRKRLLDYDGKIGHPDLKWYGQEDNHEWKQYFISDDDSSPSKCPFTHMKQKMSQFLN